MDTLRTGVILLLGLLGPVSCNVNSYLSEPITCFILDGILIIYCIFATAFYFKEKFSILPYEPSDNAQQNESLYQELERPMDTDPYQALEPVKRKKKANRKKKPQPSPGEQGPEREPFESVALRDLTAPPLSPR